MANPRLSKNPFWIAPDQGYQNDHLNDSHTNVLYRYGEYAMFVLMWHVADFEAGRVGHCTVCSGPQARIAAAYRQSPDSHCPDCFGTTFEGGYRARIIRPAILSDRDTETRLAARGEITTDTLQVESTTDFFCHNGDYLIRSDGTRYQLAEMNTLVVRDTFDRPDQAQSVGGVIPSARLEALASVAYSIPPSPAEANALLIDLARGRHVPTDVTVYDDVRGPLIT